GDVENLPIQSGAARAVLAFESFHHLPDRPRAMRGYDRVLADGGRVVLAEPGADHDSAAASIDVMARLGILEKGMELDDVARYAAGTALGEPEQVFLTYASHADLRHPVLAIARRTSPLDGNLFVLHKGSGPRGGRAPRSSEPTAVRAADTSPDSKQGRMQ